MKLWEITRGILNIENFIVDNQSKYWREIKMLYDKLVLCVDQVEVS